MEAVISPSEAPLQKKSRPMLRALLLVAVVIVFLAVASLFLFAPEIISAQGQDDPISSPEN